MKVLWLVNTILPIIAQEIGREYSNKEGWLDGLSRQLIENKSDDIKLGVCFPIEKKAKLLVGETESGISYYGFPEDTVNAHIYRNSLETNFEEILKQFNPDIVHIFGSEYPHTWAMVKTYKNPKRTIIGIQGLINECGRKYMAFLPEKIRKRKTFRDRIKKDSTLQQQNKFVARGEYEIKAIQKVEHIAGRTFWDRYKCEEINPDITYHKLNETLRAEFYEGEWNYNNCKRHQIFVSQGNYPLKGLHLILEAVTPLIQQYPEIRIIVAGDKITSYSSFKDKLKIGNYGKYLLELIQQYKLEKNVEFVGNISAAEMKKYMIESNIFLMASSVENSSNSLGEAMLLGVPAVVSRVGGLSSLMEEDEGHYYKSGSIEDMTKAIGDVFDDQDEAIARAAKGKEHAREIFDPKKNLEQLLNIYKEIEETI